MTNLLSCGHLPTSDAGCGTGYAITHDTNERICYDCANAREVADLLTADRYVAYLKVPEHTPTSQPRHPKASLTTWTGCTLARVSRLTKSHHNIGGYLYHFNATDVHGQQWYGTSPGPDMYARMRKCKTQLQQFRVYWGPTGQTLGTVWAKDEKSARRFATKGTAYRKYLGEVGAEKLSKF